MSRHCTIKRGGVTATAKCVQPKTKVLVAFCDPANLRSHCKRDEEGLLCVPVVVTTDEVDHQHDARLARAEGDHALLADEVPVRPQRAVPLRLVPEKHW